MLLLLQNVLYCLLYVMLIKCAVKNDGLNCLYFYPKEYIEEAEKRGIANKETVMKKSKWFMIPFCVIIFVALILIISIWNHVTDFKTAYFRHHLHPESPRQNKVPAPFSIPWSLHLQKQCQYHRHRPVHTQTNVYRLL